MLPLGLVQHLPPTKTEWNELTKEQKQNIKLGIKDLNEGSTVSTEEFWKQLRSNE